MSQITKSPDFKTAYKKNLKGKFYFRSTKDFAFLKIWLYGQTSLVILHLLYNVRVYNQKVTEAFHSTTHTQVEKLSKNYLFFLDVNRLLRLVT